MLGEIMSRQETEQAIN